MKKHIYILAIVLCITTLTGCDAVQRKFTRKKTVTKKPRFYQLKKYPRKPPQELYQQHFAYWAAWQRELIQVIGNNRKKDMKCAEEAVGNLKDMRNILVPSKAEEISIHVERMEKVKDTIFRGDLSFANKDDIRRTLEREERGINRDFCYSRVKDCLRANLDEEDVPHVTMAPGQEGGGVEAEK